MESSTRVDAGPRAAVPLLISSLGAASEEIGASTMEEEAKDPDATASEVVGDGIAAKNKGGRPKKVPTRRGRPRKQIIYGQRYSNFKLMLIETRPIGQRCIPGGV